MTGLMLCVRACVCVSGQLTSGLFVVELLDGHHTAHHILAWLIQLLQGLDFLLPLLIILQLENTNI